MFDFKCRGCGHAFEYLIRGDAKAVCPQCQGEDCEKQLSMFMVGTPSLTPAQKEKQSLERAGWVQVGKPFKKR